MQLNQQWKNTESDAWSEIGLISNIGNNELFWKVLLIHAKKVKRLHYFMYVR
jgi:hypothetical protein